MRRYAVVITALAVLVAAVVAFLGWRSESQRRARVEARLQGAEARLERIAAQQEEADATAASLVKALGRLCSGFDFFYKHDMARGAFRPVRCSLAGGDRTVLFAYGFDSARTQSAWVSEWGSHAHQRGATLVEEDRWAVEVMDPSIVGEVRAMVLGSP